MKEAHFMTDIRIKTIYDAASKLFISKGYSRTQINDIAHAAGISVGAVYNLFISKKAIFNFVLKCIIDETYIESDFSLPIKEDSFQGLSDEIIKLFRDSNVLFEKKFTNVSYDFCEMLSDAFDIISRYGAGFLIFQNNGSDCGELYLNYVNFRKMFCEDVEKYIHIFMERGTIRKLEYADYHARLIIETLSWWGMHVKYDAFETNENVSTTISKSVVIDSLKHAYVC
jgi:AcrR family transcriptional regulator